MARQIKKMGWKARTGLIALLTLAITVVLYGGLRLSQQAQAAIGMTPWTLLYSSTSYPSSTSIPYTVGSGSNRLLVVTVASARSYAGTQSYTVSYGGRTLTPAISDASTSAQQHSAVYYLNEAGISAASGGNFSITISGGTSRNNIIYATTLTNVDQAAPLTNARNYNSGSSSSVTNPSFSTALTENANDKPLLILNSFLASSTLRTVTPASNWNLPANGIAGNMTQSNSSGSMRAAALDRNIPTGNTSDTAPATIASGSMVSMSGASFKASSTTTLGEGVVISNDNVAPGATAQKIDGFSFVTTSGSDSITALQVTTTNQAAIASMQILNEAGTTQYFGTLSNSGSDTWTFSGGTPIPVSTSKANYKIVVSYKSRTVAPATNTPTTARVVSFTSANSAQGSDSADATLTLLNTHAASSWGTATAGDAQLTLNWSYGTPGQSVVIIRYQANTDTAKPADGTPYHVGDTFGNGGTVRYVGNGTSFTDSVGLTNGASYYYKIFEYDSFTNYYNASDVWKGPLKPVSPDAIAPQVNAGFSAPAYCNALSVPISGFAATDNVGVTGYLITTTSDRPDPATGNWSALNQPAPTSFTVPGEGSYQLYPWAKDAAGNVSAQAAPVTVVVDTTKPTPVFNVISPAGSLALPIAGFSGADSGSGVAAYMVTMSNTPPTAGDSGWSATPPVNFPVAGDGSYQLYPWVKDRAGNVSLAVSPTTVRVDTSAPTGLSIAYPLGEATNVPLDAVLQASSAQDLSGPVQYSFRISAGSYSRDSGWSEANSFAPTGLAVGTTYTWRVTARDSLGNTSAPVSGTFTTVSACYSNPPTLSLLSQSGSGSAKITDDGGSALYTLTITNNDYGGCGSTVFNLSATTSDPNDVFDDSTVDNGTVTLAPNTQATTTVRVNATSGRAAGSGSTFATASDARHGSVNSNLVTTILNVVACTPRTPLLIVGPDSGYLNRGGSMRYVVTVKNTDAGSGCGAATYNLSIFSDSNGGDFNASQLSPATLTLNAGQVGSTTLTVSAKSGAAKNAKNVTAVAVAAAGHTAPAKASVTTTVTNPLMHNSDATGSGKWSASGGWGIPGGKYGEFSCETCHIDGQKDTSNIMRINESVAAPDPSKGALPGRSVVYRRTTGSSASQAVPGWDAMGPRTSSSKVCEVCHTYDPSGLNGVKAHPYSTNGASLGNHFSTDGTDCTNCHRHNEAFRAPAGLACDMCHGNPPATGVTAGAHAFHLGLPNFSCATCHSGGMISAYAENYQTDLNLNAFGSTGARYDGRVGVTYSAGNTSSGSQTCSSVYCHGGTMGANGGSNQAPTWAAVTPGGCAATCHGASKANPPTLGSHVRHAGASGAGLACSYCHYGYTPAALPSNLATHVDGLSQVRFDPAVGAASYSGTTAMLDTYGSCNVYCHSNGLNAASPGYTPRSWGQGGPLQCNGCHGDKTLTRIATGSHSKHVAIAECSACHSATVSSGSTAISNAANHSDRLVEISFASGNTIGTAAYNGANTPLAKTSTGAASFGACTNIACHNDGTGVYTGTTMANTTPVWGQSGGCGSCHGNTSYSDYRKAAPLYASGSPKPNAHALHTQSGASTTSHDVECKFCHFSVVDGTNAAISTPANHGNGAYTLAASGATYTFEDGDNITTAHSAKVSTAFSFSYQDPSHNNETTCSNVSCHPTGLAGSKSASKTAWNNKGDCTDCHKVNMKNNTGYHHALRNYSSGGVGYPSTIPGLSAGANDNSRRCTMCHVDHNIFSPDLNGANNASGAAGNLRAGINVPVTSSSGFANSDYSGVSGSSGGICISCHSSELYKDTGGVRVKSDGSTKTPAVVLADYSSSSHEYAISSVMRRDGKSFAANCSKCHNGRVGENAVFSSMTTATHDSPVPRLYATLGLQGAPGADALFCYRCHSGAGGKDYYGSQAMSTRAKDIQAAFSSATRLYRHNVNKYNGTHRPSAADGTLAYIAANKQVTCSDCHNVHAARFGNNSTNTIAKGNRALRLPNVLKGALGTRVSYSAAATIWSKPAQASYSSLKPANRSYQVCFKCHSGAIAMTGSWFNTMTTASLKAGRWTDLALEFNPNNRSGHPLLQPLNNYPNSVAPKALLASQMTAQWQNVGNQVMTCSDCHGTDSASSSGPHGSSVKWMLVGKNKNWPYTTVAGNGGSTGTLVTMGSVSFCDNCHITTTTGHDARGAWTGQSSNHVGLACVSCHIRVPHGGKTSRLITGTNAPKRYFPDGNGGGTLNLTGIVKWSSSPSKSACSAPCSTSNHPVGSTTQW